MHETLAFVQRMGRSAGDLFKRLTKSKTPQDMADSLDAQLTDMRTRRESASKRLETLYSEIARKKAEFASAPKARQRVLELELQTRLSEYKTAENTVAILLENERHLALARGRLDEVLAYGASGVSEDVLDDLTDQIDEAAELAEGRSDAARDLERAGKRRQRESDSTGLWDALADFGEPLPEASEMPAPSDPQPAPKSPSKPTAEPEA